MLPVQTHMPLYTGAYRNKRLSPQYTPQYSRRQNIRLALIMVGTEIQSRKLDKLGFDIDSLYRRPCQGDNHRKRHIILQRSATIPGYVP